MELKRRQTTLNHPTRNLTHRRKSYRCAFGKNTGKRGFAIFCGFAENARRMSKTSSLKTNVLKRTMALTSYRQLRHARQECQLHRNPEYFPNYNSFVLPCNHKNRYLFGLCCPLRVGFYDNVYFPSPSASFFPHIAGLKYSSA